MMTHGTSAWRPDVDRWRAFTTACAECGMAADATPPEQGEWPFGPDEFDGLLELHRVLAGTESAVFFRPSRRCDSMLSGRFRPSPTAGTDQDGVVARLLGTPVPSGTGVDSLIRLAPLLSGRHVADGWTGCRVLANLIYMRPKGDAYMRSVIDLVSSGRSPMTRRALTCEDGYAVMDRVMGMRARLDPDGDPSAPDADAEMEALAHFDWTGLGRLPGCGPMYGPAQQRERLAALGVQGAFPSLRTRMIAAMCRPAPAGVHPPHRAYTAHARRSVSAMIGRMEPVRGSGGCGYGLQAGVLSLLERVGAYGDPGMDMALMDAASTLLAVGLYAYGTYGDCDVILTGRPLAEAIMEAADMPAGFVAETAIAGATMTT